jgi:hypothetical protein
LVSFSFSTLFGSLILGALHLPQDLLRNLGIAVLAVIGLNLLWPCLGALLERPPSSSSTAKPTKSSPVGEQLRGTAGSTKGTGHPSVPRSRSAETNDLP